MNRDNHFYPPPINNDHITSTIASSRSSVSTTGNHQNDVLDNTGDLDVVLSSRPSVHYSGDHTDIPCNNSIGSSRGIGGYVGSGFLPKDGSLLQSPKSGMNPMSSPSDKKNRRSDALLNALKLGERNQIMLSSSSSSSGKSAKNHAERPTGKMLPAITSGSSPIVLSKKNKSSYAYSLRKAMPPLLVQSTSGSTYSSDDDPATSVSPPTMQRTIVSARDGISNERSRVSNETDKVDHHVQFQSPPPAVVFVEPRPVVTFDNVLEYDRELEERGYERVNHFFARRHNRLRRKNKDQYEDDAKAEDTGDTASTSTETSTSTPPEKLISFYRRREYRMMWKESKCSLDDFLLKKTDISVVNPEEKQHVEQHLSPEQQQKQRIARDFYNLWCKVGREDEDLASAVKDDILGRWVETDGRGLERPLVLQCDEEENTDGESTINSLDVARRHPLGRLTSHMARELALADAKLAQSLYKHT